MTAVPPLPPRTGGSAVLKIVTIGVLATVLIVPLALVWILVAERSTRRDAAVTEIVSSIGKAQTVGGIALDLPYDALERQSNGSTATVTRHAYVHPEQLTIEATATPEIRHRSLYSAIVYRTAVRMKGTIRPPDLDKLNAAPVAIHWDRAATTVEISDLRGTLAVSPLLFGDRPVTLEPTTETAAFASGVRALTPLAPGTSTPVAFEVDLTLAGSEALRFLPTGKATTVRLGAGWPTPGFSGAFLPTSPPRVPPPPRDSMRAGRSPTSPGPSRTPGSTAPSTARRCSISGASRRSACPSSRPSTTTSRRNAR
jgi:inner membrane protein